MAVERGCQPYPLGQCCGSRGLQRRLVHRTDRSHHRSQRLGRASDRAPGRHAAACRGTEARAVARFRRTPGRRGDVRLLPHLARRPHTRHSGCRYRIRRPAAFAGRQGANVFSPAAANRWRCLRPMGPCYQPRHPGALVSAAPKTSPDYARARSAPPRWPLATPKASTAAANFRSRASAPMPRPRFWSPLPLRQSRHRLNVRRSRRPRPRRCKSPSNHLRLSQ